MRVVVDADDSHRVRRHGRPTQCRPRLVCSRVSCTRDLRHDTAAFGRASREQLRSSGSSARSRDHVGGTGAPSDLTAWFPACARVRASTATRAAADSWYAEPLDRLHSGAVIRRLSDPFGMIDVMPSADRTRRTAGTSAGRRRGLDAEASRNSDLRDEWRGDRPRLRHTREPLVTGSGDSSGWCRPAERGLLSARRLRALDLRQRPSARPRMRAGSDPPRADFAQPSSARARCASECREGVGSRFVEAFCSARLRCHYRPHRHRAGLEPREHEQDESGASPPSPLRVPPLCVVTAGGDRIARGTSCA